MSRKLKTEFTGVINSIVEAVDVFEKIESIEEIKQGLADIQSVIIAGGNKVESLVENSEEVIELYSEAAEYVYQISTVDSAKDAGSLWAKLRETLVEINLWFDSNYNKLEVVFLPYKSSMWDSLESIYDACCEDEDCDVKLVPIPYYNVNPDLTAGDMVYEVEYFTGMRGFCRYDRYRMQDRLPDVVFIHNPYDDHNRVTCIEPTYFSRKIIKYTDHLVYIPYKVSNKQVKDHFCTTEGVKNAWRVYCQSDINREVYIKYNNPEKIRAFGSPKIDAVIKLDSNKPELPDEWKERLAGRKVFFLNTDLRAVMNWPNELINFVNLVIDIMERREDIAVIWRPHPLVVETILSMNRGLLPYYTGLLQRFHLCKNGIYDEQPTPQLAMAYSDAYIGGISSMIALFGVLGKPIYYQMCLSEIQTTDKYNLLDEEDRNKYIENMPGVKGLYREDAYTLETFINMVTEGKNYYSDIVKEAYKSILQDISGNVGVNIWNDIKADIL